MHPRRPLLQRLQDLLRTPFGSAVAGGLIVLVVGAIAIEAGWIGTTEKTVVTQPSVGAPTASAEGDALTVNQIYRKDGPGVVFIRADVVQRTSSPFGFPEEQRGEATGSGFVIDEQGDILTNAHVVEGARKIRVTFGDDKTVDAKLVGQDPSNDVALLRVKTSKDELHPLSLGDSKKVKVGDAVVAIGNPLGLDRTVTTGIVSALARELQAPNGFTIQNVIQTDAAVNPGNSGGPLLDSLGRVIGINSQIATAGGGGGSIGIGFAVPVNKVKEISEQLKKGGKVERAYLGITGVTISSTMAESLNLPTDKGVLVQRATGPAKEAGVKGGDTQVTVEGQQLLLGGDVIVDLDGDPVDSMTDVITHVDSKKPGDEVSIKLRHGSKTRTVKAKLGKRPATVDANPSPQDQGPQLVP